MICYILEYLQRPLPSNWLRNTNRKNIIHRTFSHRMQKERKFRVFLNILHPSSGKHQAAVNIRFLSSSEFLSALIFVSTYLLCQASPQRTPQFLASLLNLPRATLQPTESTQSTDFTTFTTLHNMPSEKLSHKCHKMAL